MTNIDHNDPEYNKTYIEGKERVAGLFRRKPKGHGDPTKDRLPPGQHDIGKHFPILDLGYKPDFDPKTWRLKIYGAVENPVELTYQALRKLPKVGLTADFHCVTRWTKFDVQWSGVAWEEIEKLVKPKDTAQFVIQESSDGYTTNVPLEDLRERKAIVAYELFDEPLPREHGWPARVIIPNLYGWKGAKFLKGLKFTVEDEPGFWEVRGYNNHGEVWGEERYS